MDLVVRTPHGDADLTVASWSDHTTLADLVAVATGQVAPPLVQIDDHPVDSATRLEDAPILIGSVVSTHPGRDAPTGATVRLRQLTGSGAGRSRTLDDGRFRIGPGHRLSADELAEAPVEQPMFELVVDGSAAEVAPVSEAVVLLDGRQVSAAAPWRGEQLLVGTRVFTLDRSPNGGQADEGHRRSADAREIDGSLQFSRSPLLAAEETTSLVVDALRNAAGVDEGLWQRRVDPTRVVAVPFGLIDERLVDQPMRQASVTLEPGRPGAIVGDESFRESLARALLIEATARYGPADLGIVIATRSDRLGRWDWAKWLPHLRHGDNIALLSADAEFESWATALTAAVEGRTTLVVIDDADLWSRNDSPWRGFITQPPPSVVMLALADRAQVAPAATRTVIGEDSDGRCRLTAVGRSQPLTGVLPALVEPEVAATFARSLAPLRDAELPPPAETAAETRPTLTLSRALESARADDPAALRDPATISIALGVTPSGSVMCRVFEGGTTWAVEGIDGDDVAGQTVAILLSIVTVQAPAIHPIVLATAPGRSSVHDMVMRLPHFAGRCDVDDVDGCARTLARLEHHLAGDPGATATVVVDASDDHLDLVADLSRIATERPGLRVIAMSTIRPDGENLTHGRRDVDPDVTVTMDRRGGRPHGTVASGGARHADESDAFEPFEVRTAGVDRSLVVRPFVYGRALTTLERQLERPGTRSESSPFGPEIDELVDELVDRIAQSPAEAAPGTPVLVPEPLPATVHLETLLADNEADAVPIGLADDPARGRHEVVWWQPGEHGSMLFIGGPRSGMDAAIGSLPIGIAERFAPNDLHVHSIDSSTRRIAALQRIAHTHAAVTPDRLDQAAGIIDLLALEVAARRNVDAANGPDTRTGLLLLIGDLTQLGRRLRDSSYIDTIERLRQIANAGDVGVNVVASVARASDSCGLSDLVDSVFVASPSSMWDPPGSSVDGPQQGGFGPGRCRWTATDQAVQLAVPGRAVGTGQSDGRT